MESNASEDLVDRLRAGVPEAWREVCERYGPVLRWVAARHRLAGPDGEDVVQTTWLRLWENLGRLRNPDALPGWLVTTCRRESLRTVRMRARQVPQDPGDEVFSIAAAGPDADPHDQVERRLATDALYAALGDLPARQRTLLLTMLDRDGASYAETSRLLRMPVGSVGPTRLRALARLREDPRLVAAGGHRERRTSTAVPVLTSVPRRQTCP